MIRVEHLIKTFGEHAAVDDVSFEVDRGETFALLGPNGSGKTTTLKCIAGLIKPSSGKILIDGFDVKTFTCATSMDKILSTKMRCNLKRFYVALLLGALWLAGCDKPKFEPVEIAAEDMCAFCKMAISEKQYAAEFLNQDGDASKFDDIGCLANQLKTIENRHEIAAFFVAENSTGFHAPQVAARILGE